MPSTPPTDTADRPERARTPAQAPAPAAEPGRAAAAPVPMRALLASCRAAEAVSTPPERTAA
ncbi:hypothetical protein [Kitasatospora phosalacinea]|uniref:Uncharacterized protein n=1 Tax=Kitasatospora phosalacinea TaxID=2065 RepID=A0ABW6GQN1_9ACTN